MSGRSPLLVLLLLLAVGAVGWLVVGGGDEVPDDRTDPPALPPTPPEPPPVTPPRAEPEPAPVPSTDPATPGPVDPVTPPPVEAPGRTMAPEQLKLASVAWEDEPALNVINDIARQAGFDVIIPRNVRALLENARVTLDLKNTTGSMVLGLVLQPYEVAYSVRPNGAVYLFVDDD